MYACAILQKVEFFEDGTFNVANDYSGIYQDADFGGFGTSISSGEFELLSDDQIEIGYDEGSITVWSYTFLEDALTLSSPAPDEFGGGLIPCYFVKSGE